MVGTVESGRGEFLMPIVFSFCTKKDGKILDKTVKMCYYKDTKIIAKGDIDYGNFSTDAPYGF